MPIKQGAFGGSQTEPAETKQEEQPSKPAKTRRTRRKKEELIADVVVPGNDDNVEVKFAATGNKGERPWLVAVELFREDKIEFVTKDPSGIDLKYAVEKMDKQKASSDTSTSEQDSAEERGEPAASDPEASDRPENPPQADTGLESGKKGSENVPPDADVGDIVRIGPDDYRVGHGGVLTQGPIEVDGEPAHPKRAWRRELGTGGKGTWEVIEVFSQQAEKPKDLTPKATNEQNGHATVTREVLDPEMTEIRPGVWKVGTGVLEKIGLPDYSGFQIGPNTMSAAVADDGRRMEVELPAPTLPEGKRTVLVAAAAVEQYELISDTVEYVTRLQRTHLIAFLEAVKPGSTAPRV